MKKIIILITMLCAFASAECKVDNSKELVHVFCKDEFAEFYAVMKKDGTYINYFETFNNNTMEVRDYLLENNHTLCERTDTDEYGVVIKKEWYGCQTPGERWNALRKTWKF